MHRFSITLLLAAFAIQDGPPPRPPGGGFSPAERKVVKDFDKDKDGRLNRDERAAARATLKKAAGGGKRPGGPMGGGGMRIEAGKPGPKVAPADVKSFPDAGLYDPLVLRTFFLTFENDDWEAELADFHNTDVEVPATLTVDGKAYAEVGLHFRGASSYNMVAAGSKRSLNVAIDFADDKQRLYGYRTLNLLNANGDASFMSTPLYSLVAGNYLAAPKANFVKVVINGESWGVYVNVQQFNKEFLQENYKTTKGARWKVPGSPQATSGLEFIGDDIAAYKRKYEIKSADDDAHWKALVELCRTLNETPLDKLEAALEPILDLDGALWFLALDMALLNSDGYWVRSSDYTIYRDEAGKFHILPGDMNEAFRAAGGPGSGGRGKGSDGVQVDPLIGLDDVKKPLRSRLLSVPALKTRYLEHVRTIATDWLDWTKLGPIVAERRALIEKEIEADTRKLSSFDAFKKATANDAGALPSSLRSFADRRRAYLLDHAEIKKLPAK